MCERLIRHAANIDVRSEGFLAWSKTEFIDRFEYISVGDFYDGNPDDYQPGYRTPSCYRNPFLVNAMRDST